MQHESIFDSTEELWEDDELEVSETIAHENQLFERYRVNADRGQSAMRVDKFLMDHLTQTSRNRIQRAADAGFIHANGKPVKSNYKVKPFDCITLMLDRPPRDMRIIPEDIPLSVVYEDEALMVINKPAGMVVHPGCGNYNGTMVHAIAWHLRNNSQYDPNDPGVGLVHRIDKDTSGLLVVAKTAEAKTHLGLQFFNKTSKRQYKALVWGNPTTDEGRIEGNIARHQKDRMQMAVYPPDSGVGKHAVTHYRVVERFAYVTLVDCILETGRTHQIRAHMKHIGHTLFNDTRYGGEQVIRGTTAARYKQFIKNCFDNCNRQALHAETLGFVHPTTHQEMFFVAEMPTDMAQLIEKWRNYAASMQ